VAGTATVTVPAATAAGTERTADVSFVRPYGQQPVVTVTPSNDPEVGPNAPKYWVSPITSGSGASLQYTGFRIHYVPVALVAAAHDVTFNYLVMSS